MISVIIPTLNAGRVLPRSFDSLIAAAVSGMVKEVIVADGGSADDTLAIADAAGAHLIQAGKGRAHGLIAGAAKAKAEWLLFLHPETALETGWESEAEAFMAQGMPDRAAYFRFALEDFGPAARRAESMANLRASLLALPYGEQGLLIPRHLYRRLGGYRPLARMEDADLVRRIGRGRLVALRARAINAPLPRQGALRGLCLSLLHALRVPARVVARL